MSTILDEAGRLLAEMNRAEKAQLLQWVVRDLGDSYPNIESRPDVLGGEPCIVRTRIPVWLLEQARRLGATESELLQAYPNLREDLANAWGYVRGHTADIDSQITENEEDLRHSDEFRIHRLAHIKFLPGKTRGTGLS